ncbi:MAG: hypothetical protein H8D67_31125, partial [Deltaproteobacteria bacterium]|nr:hypothetical protein [Deltaproteobacteria bacterium]
LNVPSEQKEARTKEFAQLLSSSPPLLDYLIEQAKAISERGDMHSSPSAKKERNEKITEIIGLMVDPSFSSRQALNPLELEDYKDTLETQLGIKRGVFKSIFEQAKKEKAKSSAQKAQEELNQRTVNVAEGQRSAGTAAGLGSERH